MTVVPTQNESQATTTTVGTVMLVPGEYEIQIRPIDIRGGELMRLFNLSLTSARSAGALAGIGRDIPQQIHKQGR